MQRKRAALKERIWVRIPDEIALAAAPIGKEQVDKILMEARFKLVALRVSSETKREIEGVRDMLADRCVQKEVSLSDAIRLLVFGGLYVQKKLIRSRARRSVSLPKGNRGGRSHE